MMPVLRHTILLLGLPAASALGMQVAPPAPPRPTPRAAPAPRPTPRPDRLETPRWEGWREFELHLPDLLHEMPDLHVDLPDFDIEMPDLHVEVPAMRFDVPSPLIEMPYMRFDVPSPLIEMPDLQPPIPEMRFHAPELEMQMEHLGSDLRERLSDMQLHELELPTRIGSRREPFATSPRAPWLQGDPADSLYKSAYELLNRGEWRRAAASFNSIPQRFPSSGYAPDAFYWQAFALYRIGGTDDLQAALRSLETMRSKYPQAKARSQSDADALRTRILGTLASRGDSRARAAIEQTASAQGRASCDREDQAVRAEALKSLVQSDPASAVPTLKRVLARKDACSAPLRRTAVFLLGSSGDNEAPAILREVALNDSEPEVRSAAIQYLGRSPSDVAVNTLDELLRTSTDQGVLRTAARMLAANPNPRARQAVRALIERNDAPERLRMEAISGFENDRATDEDAAYLRALYGKVDNPRVKARIVRVLGQLGGDANDQWLLGLMRNNDEPVEVRTAALQRVASRNMPIAEAVKLYGTVADRELREQLIEVYAQRREPEATDKLLDIAKNDTDYNLRRRAINVITRKNDPRAMKLLLEIIDK